MKNVLLANIGNRNLTHHGHTINPDVFPKPSGESFRRKTQELLERYDEVKHELNEQILSVLLGQMPPEAIEKVVLFASNQPEQHNQDTVFEAQILQRLLSERYGVPVEVVEYRQNVTDNDQLLRFYRDTFSRWQAENAGARFVICDAGGTAQQKAALKIAAEFLFEPDQYEVKYITQPSDTKQARVQDVRQIEYRRIIDEEQIAALVRHGQFVGALALFESLPADSHNPLVGKLLRLATLRLEFFWTDAQNLVEGSWKEMPHFEFLRLFKSGKLSKRYDEFKADFPNEHRFFLIAERFEIAEFHFINCNFSQAVLGYSIFLETFLNEFIRNATEFDLVGNYGHFSRRLADFVNRSSNLTSFFGGTVIPGVPLHIKFAQTLAEPGSPTNQLLLEFERINSVTNRTRKGLDELRNGMAHSGKSIDEKILNANVPDFSGLLARTRELLGLPSENSFLQLSRLILQELRR